jgi:hypothetical protein
MTHIWDWLPLFQILESPDMPDISLYYALHSMSILIGMSAATQERFFQNFISTKNSDNFLKEHLNMLRYVWTRRKMPRTKFITIFYLLRLIEEEVDYLSLSHQNSAILEAIKRQETPSDTTQPIYLKKQHLSPNSMEMGGRLIPITNTSASKSNPNTYFQSASTLVATPTTTKNMQRIADAFLLRQPVILQGSPGSGKTALVEECARLANHQSN